ncbi:MAG: hypothetical protein IRZ10_09570 [Thermoflavifilum sp.]|nr:hypothetical protein [Thermoflavifilum sp.]MCL6514655.1 hypothetical protein [Alicyclobacillus sp.]
MRKVWWWTGAGVCGAVLVGLLGYAGWQRQSSGHPKPGAVHVDASATDAALSRLQADSETLHEHIDDFVGWGGAERLREGDAQLWAEFSNGGGGKSPLRDAFRRDVEQVLRDLASAHVNRLTQLRRDAQNLLLLLSLADKHHGPLGAQALVYYHRVSEDIHYYLTGKGEEYSVSEVEGSREVDQFLQPYLAQLSAP